MSSAGWTKIGHLDDDGCQECVALGFDGNVDTSHVVVASNRPARYQWWPNRQSTAAWCANFVMRGYPEPWCTSVPTRLCVECCARWRSEVEAHTRQPPHRISEIHPTEVFVAAIGERRES